MKKLFLLTSLLLFFLTNISCASKPQYIGSINDKKIKIDDLPLKQKLMIYEQEKMTDQKKEQIFTEYVFANALEKLAKEKNMNIRQYFDSRINENTSLTADALKTYIEKNKTKYDSIQDAKQKEERAKSDYAREKQKDNYDRLRDEVFKDNKIKYFSKVEKLKVQIPLSKNNPKIGPDSAKIKVVLFSDYSCPYCRRVFPKLLEIAKEYPKKVQLIYNHFTLHKNSLTQKDTIATHCAKEQNMFFDFAEKIYQDPSKGDCTQCLVDYAKELKMDENKFKLCFEEKTKDLEKSFIEITKEETKTVQDLGISSAPTFFINGTPILGDRPKETIKKEMGL